MEFKTFKLRMTQHINKMLKDQSRLFTLDVDKEELWDIYLDSFPEGTNEIFRERREYDCSCCRNFIKTFGNVVAIDGDNITTIWDFNSGDPEKFQVVIDSLAEHLSNCKINGVFVTKEAKIGTDYNHELIDGVSHQWSHFYYRLPSILVSKSNKSIGDLQGRARDSRNLFKRSLDEISIYSVEVVLDLIAQKSLYKGEEWQAALKSFLTLKKKYKDFDENQKELFTWKESGKVGGVVARIKNTSIGTLLNDISKGMGLDKAVQRYESVVAPTNYKRPKAIFTKRMVEQAQKKVEELGLSNSLERRHATIDDIKINNILFANKDSAKRIQGNAFDDLINDAFVNHKDFSRVEEVSIERFVKDVLPNVTEIEALFESKHKANLVSLIAPANPNCNSLLKWDNGFSWSYSGNITDSMKERVKAAGGNVDGVLRFSLQWNENGDNQNDFDAHCHEPDGNHIYYPNKRKFHPSSGMLDVDIIQPESRVAVENIVWTDINKMKPGNYTLFVDNYTHRGGRSGFTAEVEFDDQIFFFGYGRELKQGENVIVATVHLDKNKKFSITESLSSQVSSKEIWGLKTNQFHPVSVAMYSPNYWDEQKGLGHRHYFFMLKSCLNPEEPNGFFNEFLREPFMEHKKVFEALGSKMKVKYGKNQLSGLGFSSTKRDSLICKVSGNIKRTLVINF